jgi:hypothetical protein
LCGIAVGIALPALGVAATERGTAASCVPFVPLFPFAAGVPATGVCGRVGTAGPVIVARGGLSGGFAAGAGGRSGGVAGGFASGGFAATPATGVTGFVGGSAGIGGFVAGAPTGGVAVRGAVTDFARGAPAGEGTNGFAVAAAIGCVVR